MTRPNNFKSERSRKRAIRKRNRGTRISLSTGQRQHKASAAKGLNVGQMMGDLMDAPSLASRILGKLLSRKGRS